MNNCLNSYHLFNYQYREVNYQYREVDDSIAVTAKIVHIMNSLYAICFIWDTWCYEKDADHFLLLV